MLGLTLITSQAFLYNAIFFTYALVLVRFYGVPASDTGIFLLPFALGNFLGPLLLGRFFDTIGRRVSIASTYAVSGLLLLATGALFVEGKLTAQEQTLLWSAIFFFASAAASAAYLTISELFPLELRALAIAVFFAFGTAIGGVAAPWLFGALIATGSRESVFLRLRARRGADAGGRRRRGVARRRRGAEVARARRAAVVRRRSNG